MKLDFGSYLPTFQMILNGVFQIPNFLVINNSLIHTFAIFSSTILLYLVSFFVEKFYLFSKSVIPSQQTINSFCKELCEEKKIFFEILFKDTTMTGL
jgi:hypothetical protein